MSRKLFAGSIAVATVVAAVLIQSAMSASATSGTSVAATGDSSVYLAANGKNAASAAVTPQTAPISQDSSLKLSGMTWTSWSDSASGTGSATVNLCDPNCATGKSVTIPVTVTLSAPQQLCGHDFYTDMRLAFQSTPPNGLPSTTTVPVAPLC
ncbi:hypothetical protein AB0M47_22165 [Hamadaea sp. NPDC051192]|uniref:hypothetical protein n=1 Tax=Hamadaea sp. NPDC051192 TaxID=3154940 RepID=UPI00342B1406